MNKLSWMLYGAEVVQNLGILMVAVPTLALLVYGLAFVVRLAYADANGRPMPILNRRYVVVCLASVFLGAFFPSSRTVYLVAASETAETAITTPEAREMMDLVRRKLREMLSEKA